MIGKAGRVGELVLTIVGLAAMVVFTVTNKPKAYWITLVNGAPFLVSGILYFKCWRRIKKVKYSSTFGRMLI